MPTYITVMLPDTPVRVMEPKGPRGIVHQVMLEGSPPVVSYKVLWLHGNALEKK